MGPCKAPTFSSSTSTAKPECGCQRAAEAQPVPVWTEHRAMEFAPIGFSPAFAEERFPSGLVVVLAGAAAMAWTRQRLGARLVELHLARPEPGHERRRFWPPRRELSGRERRLSAALTALLERAPRPALVPLRAAISRRPAGR
jgi:hypothetical protein